MFKEHSQNSYSICVHPTPPSPIPTCSALPGPGAQCQNPQFQCGQCPPGAHSDSRALHLKARVGGSRVIYLLGWAQSQPSHGWELLEIPVG